MTNSIPTLAESAVQVRFRGGRYGETAKDDGATATVLNDSGATPEAGEFRKRLFARDSMKRIRQTINGARAMHYHITVPWLWKGPAILPSVSFDRYCDFMDNGKLDLADAKSEFKCEWPSVLRDAESQLNGLFNVEDYPSPDVIIGKCYMDYRISGIPATDDIRANVTDAQRQRIEADSRNDERDMMAQTTAHIAGRVSKLVSHMADALRSATVAKNGNAKGFHSSLVSNVADLVEIMDSLNLAGDKRITDLAKAMKRDLLRHDADALKESDNFRTDVADKATAIAKSVGVLFA